MAESTGKCRLGPWLTPWLAVSVALAFLAPPVLADEDILAVHTPPGEIRSIGLFLVTEAEWAAGLDTKAATLAERHKTLAIGIEAARFTDDGRLGCRSAAERLTERAAGLAERAGAPPHSPVLIGSKAASPLALEIARLTPERYKGLLTEHYGASDGPVCQGASQLGPQAKAPLRWRDLVTGGEISAVAGLPGVKVVKSDPDNPEKSFYHAYFAIAGADAAFRGTPSAGLPAFDLPVTIHAAHDGPERDTLAIFLSGDGGWAPFDAAVADRLAAQGVTVIGISSLRYFWTEKTPGEIATDISEASRAYLKALARQRLLLVGFSLGANATPFYARRLDPDIRNRVAGIGLLAPESRTGFEIRFGGWFGQETGTSDVPGEIADLLAEMPQVPLTCLHGTRETSSPCPDLPRHKALTTRAFEGGHHLAKDHDGIAKALLALIDTPGDFSHVSNSELVPARQ